jgi:hypothetical protein
MLQLDPMNTGHDEPRAETGLARRQHIEGRRLACKWIETTPQIGKHLARQGPGLASMLAAGEMEGLRSARPVSDALRRGICSRARCGGKGRGRRLDRMLLLTVGVEEPSAVTARQRTQYPGAVARLASAGGCRQTLFAALTQRDCHITNVSAFVM